MIGRGTALLIHSNILVVVVREYTGRRSSRVTQPVVAASLVPGGFRIRPDVNRSVADSHHPDPRALITPRDPVIHPNQPSAADSPLDVADEVDETALAAAMRYVPLGTGVLAGAAVALLVLGYLLIYALVFLPRGSVG